MGLFSTLSVYVPLIFNPPPPIPTPPHLPSWGSFCFVGVYTPHMFSVLDWCRIFIFFQFLLLKNRTDIRLFFMPKSFFLFKYYFMLKICWLGCFIASFFVHQSCLLHVTLLCANFRDEYSYTEAFWKCSCQYNISFLCCMYIVTVVAFKPVCHLPARLPAKQLM